MSMAEELRAAADIVEQIGPVGVSVDGFGGAVQLTVYHEQRKCVRISYPDAVWNDSAPRLTAGGLEYDQVANIGGVMVRLYAARTVTVDDVVSRAEVKADERAVEAQGTRALGEQLLRDQGKG